MPTIKPVQIPAGTSIKQKITNEELNAIKELLKNFNHKTHTIYQEFLTKLNSPHLAISTRKKYKSYIRCIDKIFSISAFLKDFLNIVLYLNNNNLGYHYYYQYYAINIKNEIKIMNTIPPQALSVVFNILRSKENNILKKIFKDVLKVQDNISEKDPKERIKNNIIFSSSIRNMTGKHHKNKARTVRNKNYIKTLINNFTKTNKPTIYKYLESQKAIIHRYSLKHIKGLDVKLIGFGKPLKDAAENKEIIIYIKSNIFIKDKIENIEKLISNGIIISDKTAFSLARRIIASLIAPGKLLNKKFEEIDQSQNKMRVISVDEFIKEIAQEESDISDQISSSGIKSQENNDESVNKKPAKRKIDDSSMPRDHNAQTTSKRAIEDNNEPLDKPSKKIRIVGTNEMQIQSTILDRMNDINDIASFQNLIIQSINDDEMLSLSQDSNFDDLINKFLELFGNQTTECELFSKKGEKINGKAKIIYEMFETEIKEIAERSKKDNKQNKSSEINQCKMFAMIRILNGLDKENHINPNPNLTDTRRNTTIQSPAQKI